MSLELSKWSLAKATIRDLEDYKKWLSKSTFPSSGGPATEYTAPILDSYLTLSLKWLE